jgi:hypothetical protein
LQPHAAGRHGAGFLQFVTRLHLVVQRLERRFIGKPALPQSRQANPDPVAFHLLVPAVKGALVEQSLGDLFRRQRLVAKPLQRRSVHLNAERVQLGQ